MSRDSFIHPRTAELLFYLPELKFDHADHPPDIALSWECYEFSANILATALSQKCSQRSIKEYLQRFPREEVSRSLEHYVNGPRIMTYAVDTGNTEIVQLLHEYNGNANSEDFEDNVPLLAFAIMRATRNGHTSLEMVKLLLSYGADPLAIPKEMWKNYVKTPIATKYDRDNILDSERWCVDEYRLILAKSLDLTTRYYLWRASRLGKPARRMLQITAALKMTALLRLPFRIIGQELTVKLVIDTVYTHMAQDTEKPLVVAFAGASGHGKTELATQMGSLLSIQNINIDCTHINSHMALFGSTFGYESNANGAPLNNFLVDNQGKRCVVFLDEFDKTDYDTRNALLKVMDDGTYRDRRGESDHAELDCRRVIWILATNLGNDAISRFHSQYLIKCSNDEDRANISIEPLQNELEELYMSRFSPAVTGRIDEIAPFFPFDKGEQAVVAHKFLLKFIDEVRCPIDEGTNRLVGHTNIRVIEDGKVCEEIARKWYKERLGARSIYKGVRTLRRKFILKYVDMDGLVSDGVNKGDCERYVIQLNPTVEDREELSISRIGQEEISTPTKA